MLAFVLSFAVYTELSSPNSVFKLLSLPLAYQLLWKFPVRKDVEWGSCERVFDGYVSAEGAMLYCLYATLRESECFPVWEQ